MQVLILDEDIDAVENALVVRLRSLVDNYDKGSKGSAEDMEIAALIRSLRAIGRPYSTQWNRDLGRTMVIAGD